MASSDPTKVPPPLPARAAIAAILDDLDERVTMIQADPGLSPMDRAQLVRAVRTRAQVELGQLAGVTGVDQVFLAQILIEVLGLVRDDRPQRSWWRFWQRD